MESSMPSLTAVEHLNAVVAERVVAASVNTDAVTDAWDMTKHAMSAVEWMHVGAGMPWWAAIVTGALAIRTFAAPFYFRSIQNGARMAMIAPDLKVIQDRMAAARTSGNRDQFIAINKQRVDLMKKNDVSVLRPLIGLFVQMPFFIFYIAALRHFAMEPELFDGFTTGGLPTLFGTDITWFHDLSQKDPTFLLPIASSAAAALTVQTNPNIRDNRFVSGDGMRRLFTGMSILFLPVQAFFPASVNLYLATTSLTMLVQTASLRLEPVQRALGLPAGWPHVGPVETPQYSSVMDAVKNINTMFDSTDKPAPVPVTPAASRLATGAKAAAQPKLSMLGGLKAGTVPPPPSAPEVSAAKATSSSAVKSGHGTVAATTDAPAAPAQSAAAIEPPVTQDPVARQAELDSMRQKAAKTLKHKKSKSKRR